MFELWSIKFEEIKQIQFLPHSKHHTFITKTDKLMFLRNNLCLLPQLHETHKYILCWQTAELWQHAFESGRYIYHWAVRTVSV